MSDPGRSPVGTALARVAAVCAAGGVTYAAVTALGRDPLKPTAIVSVIVLVKLAMSYRSDRRE